MLVLDKDVVAWFQWRKLPGAPRECFLHGELSVTVSLSLIVSGLAPILSESELAGLERERVPDSSAEHDLGGAEAGDRAGSVPVHQDGPDQLVSVEGPGLRGVASNDPLSMLDSKLRSLVSSGIVGC